MSSRETRSHPHLYSGSSQAFLQDSLKNRLTQHLEEAFFQHYGHKPHPAEVAAWRNSLDKIANVLHLADLTNQGISIEYRLPMISKRLDWMVLGYDERRRFTRMARSGISRRNVPFPIYLVSA